MCTSGILCPLCEKNGFSSVDKLITALVALQIKVCLIKGLTRGVYMYKVGANGLKYSVRGQTPTLRLSAPLYSFMFCP